MFHIILKKCWSLKRNIGLFMITTKEELNYYILQDAISSKRSGKYFIKPRLFGDEIWKFQLILRKTEYYFNLYNSSKKHLFIPYIWYRYLFHKTSVKLGFSIPLNVFGPGLAIPHYGTITVNSMAKVGKNCRLHEGVNIGATNGSKKAPCIGDNVFIGTGAKIIGDIVIADNVVIGANAVVVKSITESGGTYGGVPAKKISSNDSHMHLPSELF